MTTIEWTEVTWNPTVGCSRVSAGCDNCYAIPLAVRFRNTPAYAGTTTGDDWSGRVNELPKRLLEPFGWKGPTVAFVNSMSDLMHPDIDVDYLVQIFAVMAATPQHTYQVLTKRPKRFRILDVLRPQIEAETARVHDRMHERGLFDTDPTFVWPLPNVWLGTSIEDQRVEFRTKALRAAPAAVRFISAEPLLGDLRLDMRSLDWVIVGGEAGRVSRPMAPAWVRQIRDDCDAADVAFFFKQWGQFLPVEHPDGRVEYRRQASKHFPGFDLLDGRKHLAMPANAVLTGPAPDAI